MGFVKANCELNDQRWQPKYMPGWNADWTTGAVASVETTSDAFCDEWVDHPVLVVQRDTFANFFHDRYVPFLQKKTNLRMLSKCCASDFLRKSITLKLIDFLSSEDFFNVFIAMAVLEWKAGDIQIYLTDLYPKGPFW